MTVDLRRWRGIFAVMITPLADDLSIDVDGLRRNTEFLVASGVDVLVVLGSEGEFYALTDAERRLVVETVAATAHGSVPVVAGVSHPSSTEAVALARHAARSGVDAVMATGPYYAKADANGLKTHFSAIAECGLPAFAYNSPGRVGYDIPPAQLADLIRSCGLAGAKQAAPDISELADLVVDCGDRAAIVGGAEIAIWPALCVGAAGNTATAASALPGVFRAVWRASRERELERGQELYARMAPLREAYRTAGGQAAVVKRLCELVGLAGGPPRPPTRRVSGDLDARLRRIVADLKGIA